MNEEANKALVRRLVDEGVNNRNLDVLAEVATGAIAEAARRWIGPFRESFPDFSMEIVDLIAATRTIHGVRRLSVRLWPWGSATSIRRPS